MQFVLFFASGRAHGLGHALASKLVDVLRDDTRPKVGGFPDGGVCMCLSVVVVVVDSHNNHFFLSTSREWPMVGFNSGRGLPFTSCGATLSLSFDSESYPKKTPHTCVAESHQPYIALRSSHMRLNFRYLELCDVAKMLPGIPLRLVFGPPCHVCTYTFYFCFMDHHMYLAGPVAMVMAMMMLADGIFVNVCCDLSLKNNK